MSTKKPNYPLAITHSGGGPWHDWLESDEGKVAMGAEILVSPRVLQYLENRLWSAYTAGLKEGWKQREGL